MFSINQDEAKKSKRPRDRRDGEPEALDKLFDRGWHGRSLRDFVGHHDPVDLDDDIAYRDDR